jgi:hypothetical protein
LALTGLALALVGIPAAIQTVDVPWLRSTGAVGFVLTGAGAWLAGRAAMRDKRGLVRFLAVLGVLPVMLWSVAFFVLFRLPPSSPGAPAQTAPRFTLPDHTGTMVSLDAARAAGPVLLVFFRGHW